ncbi:MAG: hypothetical protein GX864_04495 [Mollicutes bacterium]|nr:hypothetical protein [Mollicutes bacterium]
MKVLILTCSYGEGHNSVSKAIEEELKERNISVQILDTSIWGNKFYSKIKLGLHANAAIKTPKLLNAIYKIGLFISNDKVKSPVYMKNAMSANSLKDYILEHEFDVVVSTHLFSMQTLSYLINRGFKIKSYGVITDYCYIPFIEETNLDYYFIPHKSLIKDFQRKGLPKRKLLGFGIPLKMNLREELSISEAIRRLNI